MRLFALVPVMPFYKLTYFPLITYEKLVERKRFMMGRLIT